MVNASSSCSSGNIHTCGRRLCMLRPRAIARKSSTGGPLRLCRWAWHSDVWQNLHWFISFIFHFGGAKPTKAPHGDGHAPPLNLQRVMHAVKTLRKCLWRSRRAPVVEFQCSLICCRTKEQKPFLQNRIQTTE